VVDGQVLAGLKIEKLKNGEISSKTSQTGGV